MCGHVISDFAVIVSGYVRIFQIRSGKRGLASSG
jgi:hypothetical protein